MRLSAQPTSVPPRPAAEVVYFKLSKTLLVLLMTSSDQAQIGPLRQIRLAIKLRWASHLCATGRFQDAATAAGEIVDATQGAIGAQRIYVVASIMRCSALMWDGKIADARVALDYLSGELIASFNGANHQHLILYCNKLSAALGQSKNFHMYMSHSPDVDALWASEWLKRALPLE